MKVIVGLGNPGDRYKNTRHNAGAMLVDLLVKQSASNGQTIVTNGVEMYKTDDLVLVKSKDYYMNESGKIIEDLKYLGIDLTELYVAHDDLDLRLGEYKIHHGKGPEVHGGVNDIERAIGKDFWRIRIGIDNRGTPRIAGEEYVLQNFLPDEIDTLQSVIDAIVKGFN